MNALEEENEYLVHQLQQAYQQIQDLQVQPAKLESHQQDIQPLILKLCRQQEKISSLEYSIVETQKLKIQNAKLLDLANNEMKLQEDNERLKKLNLQRSKILEQKNDEIENLTRQLKSLIDEIPTMGDYKYLGRVHTKESAIIANKINPEYKMSNLS